MLDTSSVCFQLSADAEERINKSRKLLDKIVENNSSNICVLLIPKYYNLHIFSFMKQFSIKNNLVICFFFFFVVTDSFDDFFLITFKLYTASQPALALLRTFG